LKTAEEIVYEKNRELISVPFDTPIKIVIKKMLDKKIGTILVKKGDEFIGFWTERDLMRNLNSKGFDLETAIIGNYLEAEIYTALHTDNIFRLFDKFVGMGIRYLLVKKGEKYIGLLSRGDVIRASLFDKNETLKELNAIVSWEYYDNWRWKKK
jgi:signal-transduction protein with cAMP-binding, CBS, and nucleotidyltransferase domain